jgi:hypothetical protein
VNGSGREVLQFHPSTRKVPAAKGSGKTACAAATLVRPRRRGLRRRRRDLRRRLRRGRNLEAGEERGVEVSPHELGRLEETLQPRHVRRHPEDDRPAEGVDEAAPGLLARPAPRHDLGEHRVVVDGDLAPRLDSRVDPHPGTARLLVDEDRPDLGKEAVLGILRVEAPLDGVGGGGRRQVRGERLARGDGKLERDEVEPPGLFRHRMLDLEAGVHLEEEERAVGVEEELDRARVDVADLLRRRHGRLAHPRAERRRHDGRRALLHDLLVAALDRALPLAERDDPPVRVAEDLDSRWPLRAPIPIGRRASPCHRRRPRP